VPEQLLEDEVCVCDLDEYVSIAISVLAVLRELRDVDPIAESDKYGRGWQIVNALVARSFVRKENQHHA